MNDASALVGLTRPSFLVALSAALCLTACGDDGIVDDGTGASTSTGGSGTGGEGAGTGTGGSGNQGTGGSGNQGTGGSGNVGGGVGGAPGGGGGMGGSGGMGLPDGSDCTDDADCEGGFCLDEAGIGYPGGMCASQCDVANPSCSGDGVCVDLGAAGICIDGCMASADCGTGYMCTPALEGDICNPECTQDSDCPDTNTCNPYSGFCQPVGALAIEGEACVTDGDCESGICFDEASTGQPGGFCSSVCDPVGNTCADGNLCIDFSGGMGLPIGFCFVDCTSSADCRAGYVCTENGATDVCSALCETDADCPDTGTCNPYSGICEALSGAGLNGDPCMAAADCESGICLDEANAGQPGGSCISQCDPAGSAMCPGDGACFDFTSPGDQPFGVCFDGCTSTADCRAGYQCAEAGAIDVCNPNCESDGECVDTGMCNPWAGFCGPLAGVGIDGDACVDDADCESGFCAGEALTGFPGGMCYSLCDPGGSNTCPGDGACNDFTSPGDQPVGLCFDGCATTADCRAGYGCYDGAAGGECSPDCDADVECVDTGTCNPYSGSCEAVAGLAIDGDPCLGNADCESGFCLDEPNFGFPGGYCASFCTISAQNCPADADDGVTSPCLDAFGTAADMGLCFDGCINFGDCRVPDYQCQDVGAPTNICI